MPLWFRTPLHVRAAGPPHQRRSALRDLPVRAPHAAALRAADEVLGPVPAHLVAGMVRRGVRLWLLDRGEGIADVPLSPDVWARRWLDGRVATTECAGLTLPAVSILLLCSAAAAGAAVRHARGASLPDLPPPPRAPAARGTSRPAP